jgi:hypothetical protein
MAGYSDANGRSPLFVASAHDGAFTAELLDEFIAETRTLSATTIVTCARFY